MKKTNIKQNIEQKLRELKSQRTVEKLMLTRLRPYSGQLKPFLKAATAVDKLDIQIELLTEILHNEN